MEVGFQRHPGDSTISSQLWMKTTPMADKSWQPREGKTGSGRIELMWKEGGKGGEIKFAYQGKDGVSLLSSP